MFGTGERFEYRQCNACGCLQISDPPPDMARYYPSNYYSYGQAGSSASLDLKARTRNLLAHYGPSWLFSGKDWWEKGDRKALRDAGIHRSARILDLGCGRGEFIDDLRNIGFSSVLGADPFIQDDIAHPNGVRVLKREAADVDGSFDVVMMHHSLEHIWDQHGIVAEIARLLAPGGRCIIRIPTVDSWAWEEYGVDWVQLDAPRHFYLHSRASIKRLLEGSGFTVTAIVDDSISFQILGSEKIRRGFPLINPETNQTDYSEFLPNELIEAAPHRVRQLNKTGRGDSIAVHARR
jgi:SAM-dependent methyltransferase